MRVAQRRMSSSASHQALHLPLQVVELQQRRRREVAKPAPGLCLQVLPLLPRPKPLSPLIASTIFPSIAPGAPRVGPRCPLDSGLWQSEQGSNLLLGASCTLHTGQNKETGIFQTIKMIDNDKQSVIIGRTTAKQFTQVSLEKVKSYMRVSEVVISAIGTMRKETP